MTLPGARPVKAATGTKLSTLGWQQEGALRMLQNNLDPEVAERPDDGSRGPRPTELTQDLRYRRVTKLKHMRYRMRIPRRAVALV